MATRTISTLLAIKGEAGYRQSIANINSALSNHQTQLKLVQSQYQNHQNSMAALQAKEKALKAVYADLEAKVGKCKDAYQNAQSALTSYQSKVESLTPKEKAAKDAVAALNDEAKTSGTKWADYNEEVREAEEKLEKLKKTSGDTSEEEEKLQKVIANSKSAMAELEAETDGTAKTAGELITEQRNLTSELAKAEAGQEAAAKACNSWQKQEANAQIQLNNVNASLELNEKYLDEAAKSADGCATSIDEFGNRAEEAGDESTKAMQALSSVIASAGLLRGFKTLASAQMDCATAAGEFYSQMSTVEAISGATSSEMTELTAAAKNMGATTSFTAIEAGQALEYMAMAGWSADEMLDGLSGVMNLAAAEGGDLATVSDIVTDALTAFGLAASDSAHFSDVLAKASSSSNTTVSMLGESFQMVGTTAGALGYSIEDVSVALGAMANMGIKGQTAGTGLATAFTRMSGTNDTATVAMEKLGLSMYDTYGEARDLSDFLDDLRDAFADMTDQEKESYAYMLAGQKGMKSLLAIVNTSADDWDSLTEAIANCNGAAELMAATKLDNYAGQITLLESAMDGLSISVGEVLTPALGDCAEAATAVLNGATDFVNSSPEAVAALAALTVSLGVVLAGVTALTVALPLLKTAFDAVTEAAMRNPVGLIAVGATAAIAGITTLIGVMASYIDEQKVAVNEAKALGEQLESTREAYEGLTEENETAAKNTKALATELKTLTEKESRDSDEKERLKNIVAQLNEAVPGLALAYDEETDSINMTTEALKAMVEAHSEQTEHEAVVARMNELYNEQAAIQSNLEEAQLSLTEAQEGLASSSEDLNAVIQQWGPEAVYYNAAASDAAIAVSNATEEVDLYSEQLAENEAELEKVTEMVNNYNAAQDESDDAIVSAVSAAESLAESLITLEQSYDDAYQTALDSIQGQVSLWDEMDSVSATSTQDIMDAIDSQISYWSDYADNLESLQNRNIDGLNEFVSAVDDGSADSAAYIAGMVNMSDEELEKLIASYGDLRDEQHRAAGDVADVATSYTKTMDQVVQECVDTLNDMDLSKEAKAAAVNILVNYIGGINEELDDVEQAAYEVPSRAVAAFERGLDYTIFDEAGRNTVLGYNDGILSEQPFLRDSMHNIIDCVKSTTTGDLEEHSPSKVFERYGKYTVEGFVNGVNNKQNDASNALSDLASAAINAFTSVATGSALKGTGSDTISGFTSGAQGKNSSATSTMATLASNALKSFQQKSTSSSLKTTGTETLQGYINGVNAKMSATTNKMYSMATTALSKFKAVSTSSSLYSAGTNTLQGYINGLSGKASSLYSKMSSIASAAIASFKKKLGIASPSKVFAQLAGYTAEGYTQGLSAHQDDVNAAMQNMAQTASDAFANSMNYDMGSFSAEAIDAYTASRTIPLSWSEAGRNSGAENAAETISRRLEETLREQFDGKQMESLTEQFSRVYGMLEQYFPKFCNPKVAVDMGSMAAAMDDRMGRMEACKRRGN